MGYLPVIGILMGDSAGVGPELVANLAITGELTECCRPILIGDTRVFERGLSIAKGDIPHKSYDNIEDVDWDNGIPILDMRDQDPAKIPLGESSAYCGEAIIRMITTAVELTKANKIEGFAFAPLNKNAMKLAGMTFESEDYLMAHLYELTEPFGEISVLDDIITTRTTSHIPIKDVSDHLSVSSILRALKLCRQTLVNMGINDPLIGVAALNPHAGEDGLCGREELDVIKPAMDAAAELGIRTEGPYAGDTLFNRAFAGCFDGVVTMYHDQGQIALKVKGFERGVTISGGQPYPIVTCSHGSAYDIAGKNIAKTTSLGNAVRLTARMAANIHEATRK